MVDISYESLLDVCVSAAMTSVKNMNYDQIGELLNNDAEKKIDDIIDNISQVSHYLKIFYRFFSVEMRDKLIISVLSDTVMWHLSSVKLFCQGCDVLNDITHFILSCCLLCFVRMQLTFSSRTFLFLGIFIKIDVDTAL